MEIEKKAWKEMFQSVFDGKKKFDLRLDDDDFKDVKEGDVLVLKEWDEEKGEYTGREIRKKISYLLRTRDLPFWSGFDVSEKGLVVMSLEDEK